MLEKKLKGKGETKVVQPAASVKSAKIVQTETGAAEPVAVAKVKAAKPDVRYSNRYAKKKTSRPVEGNVGESLHEVAPEEVVKREIPLADDFKFSSASAESLKKIEFDEDEY
ncbi:hypothetical protein SDC9_191929 [bioreactor metagenome]|uniref:Uncharacterized protein n=1 Tax=bioreactor metagenome TaxID=1076179 RepID=A0A645I7I8_9ZZZZ